MSIFLIPSLLCKINVILSKIDAKNTHNLTVMSMYSYALSVDQIPKEMSSCS